MVSNIFPVWKRNNKGNCRFRSVNRLCSPIVLQQLSTNYDFLLNVSVAGGRNSDISHENIHVQQKPACYESKEKSHFFFFPHSVCHKDSILVFQQQNVLFLQAVGCLLFYSNVVLCPCSLWCTSCFTVALSNEASLQQDSALFLQCIKCLLPFVWCRFVALARK